MPDPLTDLEAAQTFTKEHGFGRNRFGHQRYATIQYGPTDSPKRGKPQCACKVWKNYDYSQCHSVGKVKLADGTTWCGTHAPAAVAKRDAKRKAKRKANHDAHMAGLAASSAAGKAQKLREAAYPKLLEALQQIAAGHNDARGLAASVLAEI